MNFFVFCRSFWIIVANYATNHEHEGKNGKKGVASLQNDSGAVKVKEEKRLGSALFNDVITGIQIN